MIDFSNTSLSKLAVHKVGNKLKEESLKISKGLADVENEATGELLLKYFLSPFNTNEFYNLCHPTDISLNEIYSYSEKIFSNDANFYIQSIAIAKHLFEKSNHPKIKTGELYVCLFSNCRVENQTIEAIGIFKSERKESFLKVSPVKDNFEIDSEKGINVNKLDKGCIVFNMEQESGYRACIVDKSNKTEEAQYWKDDFLNLKPCADNYHHTKDYLNITKTFVTEQLSEEVSKAEKIDILNRSMEYFKNKEQFNEQEFAGEVFENTEFINSFSKYKEELQVEREFDIVDDFEISAPAVKKQERVFKSVLKLDKNFHIYIHGNKEMIEKGVDEKGRKFYKIFYNEEA
ncbi:MAG: nucleoid-associated protein [Bacteroidota bacterium]|nr:nucleoid-associated protein [Bacteroidota bacterium]